MAIEEFGELPAVSGLLRRALLGGLTGHAADAEVPSAELLVRAVTLDRARLARYARVCGFRLTDALPPTYPHVVAFPLMLELMTRPEFPFPVTGLVHLRNVIEQDRPIDVAEALDITVRAENLRDHDRGLAIDVVTTAVSGDRAVWRERSTYLRKAARRSDPPVSPRPPSLSEPTSAIWTVSRAVASAYAAVSGDHNPIHTSRLAARLFGFPGPIAHGMWTAARCLAALEGRVPPQCTVDITFKAPVVLPAKVAFTSTPTTFALTNPTTTRPHLIATLTGG